MKPKFEISVELFSRYLEKKSSQEETDFVNEWLKNNKLTVEDLKTVVDMPEGVRLFEQIDTKEDWHNVQQRIFKRKNKNLNYNFLFKAAAFIAIIISLALVLYFFKVNLNKQVIAENNSASTIQIVLPDSSLVYLSTNSQINYNKNFAKKRDIQLHGKAFFNVKKNRKLAFTVKAEKAFIKVLGTSFTIETKKETVEVIVATGKVAFYTNSATDTMFLLEGDKGTLSTNNELIKSRNEDINYLSWQNNIIQFNNTQLQQVIKDIENYFKVEVSVSDSTILKERYTSYFKNPTLNEVLKEMELALEIKFVQNNNRIIISRK